jgi:hypothetical protein
MEIQLDGQNVSSGEPPAELAALSATENGSYAIFRASGQCLAQ